ncbi:MAG: excinuclease ABC subunit UvrC [Clostridiaceae bacterium]
MFDLDYQLSILPKSPGVYIMKNVSGEIIYIGKAKVLRNRVRQYFRSGDRLDTKTKLMVSNVAEFEYIVTDTEMESLILEQNLIKENMPKYNISLKDDKRFPFIRVTLNEDFPRVLLTRTVEKDGSKYFGPYTDVGSVYETLEAIKKIYPLRTCKRIINDGGPFTKPCLNYHMGLCKAPCAGYISKPEYMEMINDIINILNGQETGFKKMVKAEMEEAAEALNFELAARLRDKYLAIEKIQKKQKIYYTSKETDEDYVALFKDEQDTCVQVFFLRDGKIQGREHFVLQDTLDLKPEYILTEFLESFYGKTAYIPKNIYVETLEDKDLISSFLSLKTGSKISVEVPVKGDKKKLLDLVKRNAEITLSAFKGKIIKEKELGEEALSTLADLLELTEFPQRIESYDISNIAGIDSVGSMVVFEGGKPKNSDYRRFKIKTVKGANDYDSLKEIMERRFKRGIEEVNEILAEKIQFTHGKFSFFPDLILMDGGKGQVNVALEVMKSLNLEIPVAGLVKDDRHRTRGIIYNNREISLYRHGNVLQLITRIQDEVHRFAINYHRSLRNRNQINSRLDSVPGIGEKRRKNLLMKFGSIESIMNASIEELIATPGMDKRAANSIIEFFSDEVNKKDMDISEAQSSGKDDPVEMVDSSEEGIYDISLGGIEAEKMGDNE